VLDAAYVTTYDIAAPTSTGLATSGFAGTEFPGGFGGAVPRIKATTGVTWTLGNWGASWNVKFIRSIVLKDCEDGKADPGTPTSGAIGSNPTPIPSLSAQGLCSDPNAAGGAQDKFPDVWYHDVQFAYTVPAWNTKLSFGVDNLFNQNPPVMARAFADSMDKVTYRVWDSRTPYLELKTNF